MRVILIDLPEAVAKDSASFEAVEILLLLQLCESLGFVLQDLLESPVEIDKPDDGLVRLRTVLRQPISLPVSWTRAV